MKTHIVVAIDGPSASGKSTVARLVAEKLGFLHVDTGSMYRAFTWKVLQEGLDPKKTEEILSLKSRVRYEFEFIPRPGGGPLSMQNVLDGVNPGEQIRWPKVEQSVSVVAAIPEVRHWMVERQRMLHERGDLVMEGRDIGTVVFPGTPYKFYLDASPEVRARRRLVDQQKAGVSTGVDAVGQAIIERDRVDSTRAVSPLKVAEDAVRIDTGAYDAQGVADLILQKIRACV